MKKISNFLIFILFFNFSICNNGISISDVNIFQENSASTFFPAVSKNPFFSGASYFTLNQTLSKIFIALNSFNREGMTSLRSIICSQHRIFVDIGKIGIRLQRIGVSGLKNTEDSRHIGKHAAGLIMTASGTYGFLIHSQFLLLYNKISAFLKKQLPAGTFRRVNGYLSARNHLLHSLAGRAGPPSAMHSVSTPRERHLPKQNSSVSSTPQTKSSEQDNESEPYKTELSRNSLYISVFIAPFNHITRITEVSIEICRQYLPVYHIKMFRGNLWKK